MELLVERQVVTEVAARYRVLAGAGHGPGRHAGESGAGRRVGMPSPGGLPFRAVRWLPGQRFGQKVDSGLLAVGADDRGRAADEVFGIDDSGNTAGQAADLGEDRVLRLETDLVQAGARVKRPVGSDRLARVPDKKGMSRAAARNCWSARTSG